MNLWIQLTTSSGPGPTKPAGEIHCTFNFEGPLGVAYPQHQPGVDSFDDSLRVNLKVSKGATLTKTNMVIHASDILRKQKLTRNAPKCVIIRIFASNCETIFDRIHKAQSSLALV